MNEKDIVSYMIQYEEGTLHESKAIEFFQYLVDTGLAWELQGHYGRVAKNLIKNGVITE